MEIVMRKVGELVPYERNPRRNDEAVKYVKASIEQFGFKVPIVIDAQGVIVAGHTRLKAAKELGMKEVPCIVADDLNEEQIRAFRVADNKTGEMAGWDIELLNTELLDLEANFDMADFGFEITPPTGYLPEDDDFDADAAAEAITEPTTKLGDIWQLGRHRLMCGDSTDKAAVGALMDGNKADMVFTDPPYGMNYSGRGRNTSNGILNDDIDPKAFYNIGSEIPERYIWGRVENYAHLNEKPRDVIIWKKNNFGMGSGYRGQYECCFYFGGFAGSDSDVWEVSKDTNYEHPTQKPVALACRAITNSKPQTVVDYFGGSGSTLLACESLDRTCFMMELDPKYCDVIIKRWENYTGQKAVLL